MALPPPDQWPTLPATRADAKRLGITHFLTTCKRGHTVPHLTSNGRCSTCRLESDQARRLEKMESTESTEAYDKAVAKRVRDWRSRDPEHHREYSRTKRINVYRLRAGRTPPNQSPEESAAIAAFYAECPKGLVVDHIVPFIHNTRLLAGLHVLANLQRLTPRENNRKHGRFECTPEEAKDLVQRGLAVWAKDVREDGTVDWSQHPQHQ